MKSGGTGQIYICQCEPVNGKRFSGRLFEEDGVELGEDCLQKQAKLAPEPPA